jgi:hypothetical protein
VKIVRSATADGLTIRGADPSSRALASQSARSTTLSAFKARVRSILAARQEAK